MFRFWTKLKKMWLASSEINEMVSVTIRINVLKLENDSCIAFFHGRAITNKARIIVLYTILAFRDRNYRLCPHNRRIACKFGSGIFAAT